MTTEKNSSDSLGREARQLLLNTYFGMLSTQSLEMEGFPFGSIVPFCLDQTGTPIILISRLAQHTKNIQAHNKVSLLVSDAGQADKHLAGRLSLMCEAQKVEPETVAPRYGRYYPDTVNYHTELDFDFYRLEVVKARYVGGFGKIHWLDAATVLLENPFENSAEQSIVGHMNEDHSDAILKYCDDAQINVEAEEDTSAVSMVGIDAEGMHLRIGNRVERIGFERTINNPGAARTILVEMARSGRAE